MRRILLLSLTLAVACLGSSTASAQMTASELADVEARGLFQAGYASYEAGRYDEALSRFQSAYEISRKPQLLYNVAQCLDRLRRDDEAVAAFEQYLAALPNAANRTQVEGRVRAIREASARRAAQTGPTDASATTPTRSNADAVTSNDTQSTLLVATNEPTARDESTSSHRRRRRILIITAALVVAAGVTTGVVLATRDPGTSDPTRSDIGPISARFGR